MADNHYGRTNDASACFGIVQPPSLPPCSGCKIVSVRTKIRLWLILDKHFIAKPARATSLPDLFSDTIYEMGTEMKGRFTSALECLPYAPRTLPQTVALFRGTRLALIPECRPRPSQNPARWLPRGVPGELCAVLPSPAQAASTGPLSSCTKPRRRGGRAAGAAGGRIRLLESHAHTRRSACGSRLGRHQAARTERSHPTTINER